MSQTQTPSAYAAILNGSLYEIGETREAAYRAFKRQISGGARVHQTSMLSRLQLVPLDADAASEAAECLDAPLA